MIASGKEFEESVSEVSKSDKDEYFPPDAHNHDISSSDED